MSSNTNKDDHLDPVSALLQVGFYTVLGLGRVLVEQLYRTQETEAEKARRIKSPTEQALEDNLSELEKTGMIVENQIYDWYQRLISLTRPRPNYLSQSSATPLLQPYSFDGVKSYLFVLEASMENLEKICKKYQQLSKGGIEYIPLTNRVLLTCQSLGESQSNSLRDRSKGFIRRHTNLQFTDPPDQITRENDQRAENFFKPDDGHLTTFWILAQAGKEVHGKFIPERIVACPVYLFLDNPLALVASREIYGLPSEWGWFDVEEKHAYDQYRSNIDGESNAGPEPQLTKTENTFLQKWSLDCLGQILFKPLEETYKRPLLRIQQTDPNTSKVIKPLLSFDELMQSLYSYLNVNDDYIRISPAGANYTVGPKQYLREYEVPIVLLKQFRDLIDGQQACFQSIAEVKCQLDDFLLAHQIVCDYEMDLYSLASHPILDQFGFNVKNFELDANTNQKKETVPILAAFWVRFDFSFAAPNLIWTHV